ncbi:DUF260 domain-containing protein [Cephalotus follicularis]|uniref:DUF260 domain-containing protein n=1 Tax=Cephalotus follicularis TaxID=3775 RepID=A0A1Q3DBS2_CEPFO|nr:DUF260 domain-containing protein [Cephalotus follicularis]
MGFQELARSSPHQPCAACRMLRRRCDSNCTLAPYFPSHEIQKFAGVHKVYGASNVVKMIQMEEETKRGDTIKAIVYEATARLRDPVYGNGYVFWQWWRRQRERILLHIFLDCSLMNLV